MTKAKKITLGVMATAAIALVGWDVVVAANDQKGDTVSEILFRSSRRVPLIAAAWGILTGHLFWPQRAGRDE